MYSATFIFSKREYDEEFHRLDQAIAQAARAIPGFLGEESWENPASGTVSNVYYWETLEALEKLMRNPHHMQAKTLQGRWLDGYQVVIAQVIRTYGNSQLGGIAPGFGKP
jgi:heme-degrading monooxygenase HmoA